MAVETPAVIEDSLRAFTAADAPVIRRWEGLPEPFLRVVDVLESAQVPVTTTSVALAALNEPCYAGSVLRAVIDRDDSVSLRCFAACGFLGDEDASSTKYARLTYRVPREWSHGC